MSPLPGRASNVPAAPAGLQPVPPQAELEVTQAPITILSELDSYISSRMKEQPRSLEEVASRVEAVERSNAHRHRLTLPAYFEERSYDNEQVHGAYVFRWIFKEKRAIDRALNVLGWTLVNRTYFPEAPRYLFTANGGVEVGDGILAFMPAKQALEIRALPGKRSLDRLQARMTNVEADYALMTGNPKDENIYKPELGTEAKEETEIPGVLAKGTDF